MRNRHTPPHAPFAREQERGFTLLLAALIAAIVLSIGAAIFSIAQKEVALSSTGRSSQYAFYAADTAAECALYWDARYQYFAATSSPSTSAVCDGQAISASVTAGVRSTGNFTMSFSYAPGNYCATVFITKTLDPATNAVTSVVHADGYSTHVRPTEQSNCTPSTPGGISSTVLGDQNALQRSVELHY